VEFDEPAETTTLPGSPVLEFIQPGAKVKAPADPFKAEPVLKMKEPLVPLITDGELVANEMKPVMDIALSVSMLTAPLLLLEAPLDTKIEPPRVEVLTVCATMLTVPALADKGDTFVFAPARMLRGAFNAVPEEVACTMLKWPESPANDEPVDKEIDPAFVRTFTLPTVPPLTESPERRVICPEIDVESPKFV